jgi:pyridoxamine 5'-phosphate oxidase
MADKLSLKIKTLRFENGENTLDEKSFSKNPFNQFEKWMEDAINSELNEPNAMTLATSGKNDWIDARIVLLRDFNSKGFSFFTNYNSIKGQEIRYNSKVCLNFFWQNLSRQIRIRGIAKKTTSKASDDYFNTRPRESQLGAWASSQSEKLKSKKELMDKVSFFENKFKNKTIPRPPHWGGFIVAPVFFEFWQGQTNRLHDRIIYERINKSWKINRLNP